MAIAPPSDDDIAQVRDRIRVRLGLEDSSANGAFSNLDLSDRDILIRLIARDPEGADLLFDGLVGYARDERKWSETRIKNFIKPTISSLAKHARTRLKVDHETQNTVESMVGQSMAQNTRKRRVSATSEAANSLLSVDAMIDQDQKSPLLIAIGALLKFRTGRLWYDTFHLAPMIDFDGEDPKPQKPHAIDDITLNRLITWMHSVDDRLGRASKTTLRDAIDYVAQRDHRNEPRDWIKALQWDGELRLKQLFPVGFKTADGIYEQEAGRATMVSQVARVMDPGCKVDSMPVVQSPGGWNKSKSLQALVPEPKYYRAATRKLGSPDFLLDMVGCLIYDIPELHSFGVHDGDVQKFLLTNQSDFFRAPYGYRPADHPRTSVWWGNTNDGQWYRDTGDQGRRHYYLRCLAQADDGWIAELRDQLWAEALAYWQLGSQDPRGCWWNVPQALQRDAMEQARRETEYEAPLSRWIAQLDPLFDGTRGDVPAFVPSETRRVNGSDTERVMTWGTCITVERAAIEGLKLTYEMLTRNNNVHKIGEALKALGWTSKQVRIRSSGNDRARIWLRDDSVTVDASYAPAVRDVHDTPF